MKIGRFISICILFCSCSELHPGAPDGVATKLSLYFAPQSSIQRQVWSHANLENSSKDSLYYLEFVGQSANQTADGYSPISIYQFIDSSYTNRTTSQFYISDSVVVSYGDSASLVDTRMVVLADTLKKGMRWIAADTYRTTDSVIVKIDAVVNEYYPNIRVRDSVYDNVFRVEYTISARTLESRFAEYRTGARYVWYFAEGVGVVLQYVYGASGESLWKNELIEQRIK